MKNKLPKKIQKKLVRQLIETHGERYEADIRRGVAACIRVWDDNDQPKALAAFCLEQYVPPGKGRSLLLERLDEFHNAVVGSLGTTLKVARAGQDIADRPDLPAERVLSAFSPGNHLDEDYRSANIAALAQLNFGTDDRTPPRTRAGWAARRLGAIGRTKVPAGLLEDQAREVAKVDTFVSRYNLNLDKFSFSDPKVRFPKGTKLIAHWGLRDYMTSLNGQKDALPKQRAILDLMRRVVDGEIPAEVLDADSVRWNVADGTVDTGKGARKVKGHGPLRWRQFRAVWKTQLAIDPHTLHGNLIDEKFEREREMSEDKITGCLRDVLSSPHAARIGRFVRDRLGRDLEPFDIYYSDFLSASGGKSRLGYDLGKRLPDAAALQAAIPDVLKQLGWTSDRADWVASKIRVDNGRSAGHAWPPYTVDDKQLLRVRIEKGGCDELSFSTFMHELGHCTEGVISSYEMDYKALWSVPNTAFTEGFAFTFQDRADEMLGRHNEPARDVDTLLRFWQPFEIAGPALTEIRLYRWLYKNKKASAEQIQRKIRDIGDEVWAAYYAPIFGDDGHGLMSAYSHILWGDFYLADYPMGYIIAYQIRKYLEGKPLPTEMERMCRLGSIYPESWMKAAVGSEVSVKPLLDDTERALDRLGY